jgi:hypothetical protein
MHPVYGVLTEQEFKAAIVAPAGGAAKIIRQKDPLWGLDIGDEKKFKICVSRKRTIRDTAEVTIAADNEENARKAVDRMDWGDFSWDEGYNEDCDDYEIEEVVDITSKP